MNRQDRSTLESLQRVQQFLAQYPVVESPDALGEQATELDAAIERLSTDAVDQEAGDRFVRVHIDAQRKLRQALYMEHMQPISRVAREVFGVTGMDKAFRLPRNVKVNQVLIAAAGAMAEAAEKEKTVFVRHGLPESFVDALKAAAKALDEARQAQRDSGRRRVGATAAVQAQIKRGRKAVRLLDAILKPRLAKDAQLLAAWRSAKRERPTSAAGVSGPDSVAVVSPDRAT